MGVNRRLYSWTYPGRPYVFHLAVSNPRSRIHRVAGFCHKSIIPMVWASSVPHHSRVSGSVVCQQVNPETGRADWSYCWSRLGGKTQKCFDLVTWVGSGQLAPMWVPGNCVKMLHGWWWKCGWSGEWIGLLLDRLGADWALVWQVVFLSGGSGWSFSDPKRGFNFSSCYGRFHYLLYWLTTTLWNDFSSKVSQSVKIPML